MASFTVLEASYHRNGISGEGFYVARVRRPFPNPTNPDVRCAGEDGVFLVTFFPDVDRDGEAYMPTTGARCAVVNPLDISSKWRGDRVHPDLFDAVVELAHEHLREG